MDPYSTAVTTAEAFVLLNKARKAGFARFLRWKDRDNFQHLKKLLEERFSQDPFLATQDWSFLTTVVAASDALDAFFVDQQPLGQSFVEVVEKHLDPVSDAAPRKGDLAIQVVAAIEDLGGRIWDAPDDRIVYELRRSTAEQLELAGAIKDDTESLLERTDAIRQALDPARAGFEAVGDDIRPVFEQLAEVDPVAARRLQDIVLATPELRASVTSLIDDPDAWIATSSSPGEVWAALGALARHVGAWRQAKTAYLAAVDAGFPRRARALAKASEAAANEGELAEAEVLFEKAQVLDPGDATVSILAAEKLSEATAKLARLQEAIPRTPHEEAALEANRANALLAVGQNDDAHAAAERAIALDPRSVYAKIVLAWAKNRRGSIAARGGGQDIEDLRAAATLLLTARESLRAAGMHTQALAIVADICHSWYLAREQARAVSLLEEIVQGRAELDQASPESRAAVADAAVSLQRKDLAEQLLSPEDNSDDARLTRATASVLEANKSGALDEAVVDDLDNLVDSAASPALRSQAALMRLAAATLVNGPEWSQEAETLLRGNGNEEAADGLLAQFLASQGKTSEAENVLIKSDDPRAGELLVNLAVEQDNLPLAITRAAALARAFPSAANRLWLADLQIRAGREEEAEPVLAAIRADDQVALDDRQRAYFLSVRQAYNARRYEEADRLASEWLKLPHADADAAWLRLESLLWLSRYEEALRVTAEAELRASDIDEAHLMAHVYLRGLPRAEALKKIVVLSDQFERTDDRLEGLVIVCAAEAGEQLSPELAERARQALEEFPDRFPNSKAGARRVSLGELNDMLKDAHEQSAAVDALTADVLAGRLPVAALALALGQSLSGMWSTLRVRPVAFRDQAILAEELAAAEAAVTVGAVWDPSALLVTGLLPPDILSALEAALPRSVQAHATLQDFDFAALDAAGGQPEGSLVWDAAQEQPILVRRDPADVSREREATRSALDRSRELESVPDVDVVEPTRFDTDVPRIRDRETMVRAVLFGTLSVSKRTGLPVFSDDRVVRRLASEAGLASFGTVALLDALAGRDLLTQGDREVARSALIAAGSIDLAS